MARKRSAPSPAPPPPPPPQESSSESGSDTEEEEEEPPRAAAAQKPPQNPQPHHPPASAADGTDSSEEESDSDADAQDFQLRLVSHSPAKPAAAAPQPQSDADDESSESEPEVPEPVQKKAAAINKSKTAEPEDKKRPAPERAPSGRAKKAKAEVVKATPEATPAGKGKKAKAELEKAAPVQTPPSKAKKPRGKPEKRGVDPSPSSTSETPARAQRTWSKEDLIKILEAMVAHVKSQSTLPKTDVLLAAVRDRLDRKDCNSSDLYEKVRGLKKRYEKTVSTGIVPSGQDELQMYNLSEAIWGEKATEAIAAAAAAAQNDSTVTKSKKGQSKKEKMDGSSKGGTLKEVANQNGNTQKGSKKGHAIEVKTDRDVKSKLAKENTTTATPSKSKQQGNGKEELGKDARSGTSKETATQNGDALTKRKRGKIDKDKIDVMPKDGSTGSQNGGTGAEEETHKDETEIGASVQCMHRSFDELQNLYPNLAWCVERIEAQHPCSQTLRRAFGFIGDEKANALEPKIRALRLLEVKAKVQGADLQKVVLNMLLGLVD